MDDRKIIHIDMDAFYASVEQRDNPAYRGKPLAVGGSPQARGVVAAASYEAREYGVRSAMPSSRAVKACPELILVHPRFEVYQQVSRQIHEVFREYTDQIEPLSLDEAYLDVSGNQQPSATVIAREIKRRILEKTGLTASAGVSCNKFLAKVASDVDKPNGLFVIRPDQAAVFAEALPIERFYGIGPKTAPRLQAMGLRSGADLKALDLQDMEALFGKSGSFYYGLARGVDPRPVETDWVRKSVGAENTFDHDLDDVSEMLAELRKLAVEVLDWMTRHDNFGRTLTVKVKYADFQLVTRSKTLPYCLKSLDEIMPLVRELLGKTEAGPRKIRLLGVSFSSLQQDEAYEASQAPIAQLRLNLASA